jgi:hypothetical protein
MPVSITINRAKKGGGKKPARQTTPAKPKQQSKPKPRKK